MFLVRLASVNGPSCPQRSSPKIAQFRLTILPYCVAACPDFSLEWGRPTLGTRSTNHAIPRSDTAIRVGQRLGSVVNMFKVTPTTAATSAAISSLDLGGFTIKRNVSV